ncbi:MAG: hypothetical protein EPO00_11245 [Chloroflexota bacterium]|nr:MAG: hypothetical protein EPO00_11245 [Chloroflexota bacterium]
MAIAMLIAGPDAAEPTVGPEAAERLAQIGISRIALLADHLGVGVVLEGWAFDPTRIDVAVRAIFPDGTHGVRILHDVELVTVAATSSAAGDAVGRPRRALDQGKGDAGSL